MRKSKLAVMAVVALLHGALGISHAQPATNLQLRLEPRTNVIDLVVDGDAASGAFFIYRADTLEALSASPTVAVETNTVLTNGLRFSMPAPGASPSQAFFTAAHWPGRTVEEFGEPENYPDIPPPSMVLFTSGAPVPLASGQTFTVDFFITDPAGQLIDVSGPVAILVFRESDGALHPDATVSPPTAQLTNGHLQLAVTVQSIASLDGYTLGLGPDTGGFAPFPGGLFFPASSGLNQSLRPSFNVAPATLEQRRTDNADPGPSWSYPLAGSGHAVSGTFGEWRGMGNNSVHRGVDLAADATNTVVASRGGVVLFRGTLPRDPMGDYVVIDHGNGWFSRYLHLDQSSILPSVKQGEPVARGATLATRLFVRTAAQVATYRSWGVHLHFEIRHAPNQIQLGNDKPGTAQDPLQTPSVFPVPPGGTLPELREFGLTRQHLGQDAFMKGPPTADAPGPVYLFAKFLDPEPKSDGKERKLALRAMRFQPEGLAMPVEIRPTNDTAITTFLPPGAGVERGFAKYDGTHADNPDPANWFRYWWRWDTSSYANDRKGPRSLVLTGEDHAPNTAGFFFTFGPQIKGGSITPLLPGQYQFSIVAHLGTNRTAALNNSALFVQPDQYRLEIIQANGQPLGGVIWADEPAGGYTRCFTTHMDEAVYTFTLPGGTSADSLKLRVSSRLAPDIAHDTMVVATANKSLFITPSTDANTLAAAVTGQGQMGIRVTGVHLQAHQDESSTSSGLFTIGVPPFTYNLTRPGIVLSTGNVKNYESGPSTSGGRTTAYNIQSTTAQEALLDPITGAGGQNFRHFDVTQLDLDFDMDAGFDRVEFKVVFGSEEFPEFVNSSFIDGFGIYLNGTNIAFTAGQPININHPDMRALPGTELDGVLAPGGNPVLTFSAPITPGSTGNRLTFIVADTSDPVLDTTVFVSSLQGGTR